MVSADISTLRAASAWQRAGHAVTLFTVVQTWGSAPRPIGAIAAIRHDGLVAGSVSGGCVEDDLVDRLRQGDIPPRPHTVQYGVSRDEASRFGLPCGGTLRLVAEHLTDTEWADELIRRCERHELVARSMNMRSGRIRLAAATRGMGLSFDGETLTTIHGPRWRLLLIGAGQLSRYVAQIAQTLDFEVAVCDPREEYAIDPAWGMRHVAGMPDDAVVALEPDAHTAIVALTHDPKFDDMALLEALKSNAFYVGALGSHRNTEARKERLALFDLSADEIGRLHGPVGLPIGSRTPPEIAVSVMAEIIAARNSSNTAPKSVDRIDIPASAHALAKPISL